ncbi:MAG: hypothetical protein ACFFBK_04805, partial [Promethearchaeota archaeon]
IEESQKTPLNAYSMAILEVNPDKMPDMIAGISMSHKVMPIIACWRPIAGNPNQIIDLWKGDIWFNAKNMAYRPFSKDQQWVRDLRKIAPKERIIPLYTLPYSPLR